MAHDTSQPHALQLNLMSFLFQIAPLIYLPQYGFQDWMDISFFKLTVMVTMKGPRVDFLTSIGLHEEPKLWYQQWPLAAIHLPGECRQIWVSLSWI